MPDQFIQSHIRPLPLFQTMSPEQLAHIADAFVRLTYRAGEVIFYQGQETTGMYLFVTGEGRFIQDGPTGGQDIVGYVTANQYLNEQALFTTGRETATLQVTQDAIVLYLSRQRLLDVISLYPDIRYALQTHVRTSDGVVRERATHEHVFETQRPNEIVLMQRKRHWWAFGRRLWIGGVVFIIFFVLAIISPSILALIFGVMAFVIPGLLSIYAYLEWQNDAVIITDQRVVRIDRTIRSLRTRISEVPLDSVQGVSTDIPRRDLFARIFRYGTVTIETPGDSGDMKLDRMANPHEMQQIIFTHREQYQRRRELQHRNAVRSELDKILVNQEPTTHTDTQQPNRPRNQQQSSLLTRILPTEMMFINENGDVIYRKHFLVWMRYVFLPVLMLIASFILVIFGLFDVAGVGVIGLPLGVVAFVVGALWFYWADWDWRNDMYIVGDDSITLIHKRPLFLQNEVDQIRLDRVENVISDSRGVLGRLFNVGDVRLSLLGADIGDAKIFASVHKPREVQEEISRRQARIKATAENREIQRQREMIGDYLAAYHQRTNPQIPGNAQPTQAQPGYVPPQPSYPYNQPPQPDPYNQPAPQPDPYNRPSPSQPPPRRPQSSGLFDDAAGPPGLRRLDRDDEPYV